MLQLQLSSDQTILEYQKILIARSVFAPDLKLNLDDNRLIMVIRRVRRSKFAFLFYLLFIEHNYLRTVPQNFMSVRAILL